MKAYDIIRQLLAVLPIYTDYFSDDVSVAQITSIGLTATVETSSPHGLVTGNYAHISGTLVPNDIVALTNADGIAYAETLRNHDQTEGFQPNVEIIDADQAEYNGIHSLLTVPNRKNFTYSISGTPVSPATGSPKILENLKFGYNGWHQVTVVGPTTFTYAIPQILGSPAYGTPLCRVNPRISGSVSLERAIAAYTKQQVDKLWAFVVVGNRTANKDRQTITDATAGPGRGEDFRQLIIQPLSIYVFIPATQMIAARQARDMSDDILPLLCRSLLRVRLPSGFVEPPYNGIVFSSDSFAVYNNAIYIHEFTFETTEYITYPDTVDDGLGTAFRDIDVDYISSFSDNVIMIDHINLDDFPL